MDELWNQNKPEELNVAENFADFQCANKCTLDLFIKQ